MTVTNQINVYTRIQQQMWPRLSTHSSMKKYFWSYALNKIEGCLTVQEPLHSLVNWSNQKYKKPYFLATWPIKADVCGNFHQLLTTLVVEIRFILNSSTAGFNLSRILSDSLVNSTLLAWLLLLSRIGMGSLLLQPYLWWSDCTVASVSSESLLQLQRRMVKIQYLHSSNQNRRGMNQIMEF